MRLLACGYFFKYRSAFPQSATVHQLLLESSGSTSYEKHRSLLNLLRERIWPRITTERHLPPSLTAITKHCLRASFYLRQIMKAHSVALMKKAPLEMDGYSATESSALKGKMKTWLRISEHKKKFFLSSAVPERKDVQKV